MEILNQLWSQWTELSIETQIAILLGISVALWLAGDALARLCAAVLGVPRAVARSLRRWLLDVRDQLRHRAIRCTVTEHRRRAREAAVREDRRAREAFIDTANDLPPLERRVNQLAERVETGYRDTELFTQASVFVYLPEDAHGVSNGQPPHDSEVAIEERAVSDEYAKSLPDYAKRELRKLRRGVAKQHGRGVQQRLRHLARGQKALTPLNRNVERIRERLDHTEQTVKAYRQAQEELRRLQEVDGAGGYARKRATGVKGLGSVLIIAAAALAVGLNFFLIQRPMADLVGADFGAFAAVALVAAEFAVGVTLVEALGFSRLVDNFFEISERLRRRLAWGSGALLVFFALLEAVLAIVRERLLVQEMQTEAMLSGGAEAAGGAAASLGALPMAAQAGLGFAMPFVIAVAAIALGQFLLTLRIVGLWLAAGIAALGALAMHLTAWGITGVWRLLRGIHALLTFPPETVARVCRWCARQFRGRERAEAAS